MAFCSIQGHEPKERGTGMSQYSCFTGYM